MGILTLANILSHLLLIFQLYGALLSIFGITAIAFNYSARVLKEVKLRLDRAEVLLDNSASLQSYTAWLGK